MLYKYLHNTIEALHTTAYVKKKTNQKTYSMIASLYTITERSEVLFKTAQL